MHCLTAWGQWLVELLQRIASLHGVVGGGTPSGWWDSFNAVPHCLGAVGRGTHATHRLTDRGPWAVGLLVGGGTPAMNCLTAWGQWAVELLPCTAAWPAGGGQCNSCNTLPHCLGGSGQWNSRKTPPHCLGAVGTGIPSIQCLNAWGRWAVELLQCTAAPPWGRERWNSCDTLPHCRWGSEQWNSCNAPPQCLGAVGSGIRATRCNAWGEWAVELLQCGVVWCGVVWCGVVWCGVVWCGVVWCGVVWCGVLWCGVVWCGVPKALLPKGKRPGCLPTGTGKRAGLCVLCARCA